MSDHSPTPWRQRHAHADMMIEDATGDVVCRLYGPNEEWPERAAQIVRAVNCHEALVKALRGMATLCPHCFDIERCAEARAALALVERGGQP